MRALLSQGLSELGLDVSRAETLERFSSLLLEKNNVMNLTAITEPDAVAQLHLLDSAALLPFVDLTGKTVIDVGTGAGFPGMPLRILKDDFDLTLLDSLGKRVNWLSEVCDELQLKRVACVHARAEEFAMQHREQFDIATSRAVAQLSILSELCLPLIKVGGQFIAMKSVDTEDEIAAAKSAIKTLGGHIVKVEDYTIPTSDVVHRLVIVEKVSPTPRAYPRAFAKIKKAPLSRVKFTKRRYEPCLRSSPSCPARAAREKLHSRRSPAWHSRSSAKKRCCSTATSACAISTSTSGSRTARSWTSPT